eukprot:SAG31_NODE_4029_length_3650_cov_1.509716_4_plen_187_part_00
MERYREQIEAGCGPTVVVGYDARGFVLGPPIALALKLPFVLLRKAGKNPGPLVESSAYSKEYKEHQPDKMCVRLGSVLPKDRVLLIDDLIATGGTAISGFELCEALGASVHEFAAIIELVCSSSFSASTQSLRSIPHQMQPSLLHALRVAIAVLGPRLSLSTPWCEDDQEVGQREICDSANLHRCR